MSEGLFKKFNDKYKTEIQKDTEELDAYKKNIGDKGLQELCQLKLDKVTQLLLEENGITNIDIMKNNLFGPKLTAIDLSTNKIKSIDILSQLKFAELIHLFLNSNQIQSIDILKNVNFPKLKELNLSSNQISSIKVLESVNFNDLRELDLSKNEISNLDVFANKRFPQLKELSLDQNKITSIDVLVKVYGSSLQKLKVEKNQLKSIDILAKVAMPSLTYLSIGDDTLGDRVESLEKIGKGQLEDVYLYLNENINRESDKIKNIENHFDGIEVAFNFISCDDDKLDNDDGLDYEDLNEDNKNNNGDGDGFDFLLKESDKF